MSFYRRKNPSGCRGKVPHKSRAAARKAMKILNNRQMNVYQCRRCGRWHVGRSNRVEKIQARLDQLLGPDDT
jgi:ribosomal protein L37AE/L43A